MSAEGRACHRVVTQPRHSSVISHHHIDLTEEKCTVREDPPDPTSFPAPFNSFEDVSRFLCVCVSAVLILRLLHFRRPTPAKRTLRLRAEVPPWRGDLVHCDAGKTPRVATTISKLYQPAPCHDEGGFSMPPAWPALRSPGLFTGRACGLSHLHCTCMELGWHTEVERGSTALFLLHQPFVIALGHHRDGRCQFHQNGWEALVKANLAKWKFTLAVDVGWSVLPTNGCTLLNLCFSWLTGVRTGSFLKGRGRARALPWKGLQTERTQGCTAPPQQF